MLYVHANRRAITSQLGRGYTVDSQKLDCGQGTMYAVVLSSQAISVRGWSCSNFLASAVVGCGVERVQLFLMVRVCRSIPKGSKYPFSTYIGQKGRRWELL